MTQQEIEFSAKYKCLTAAEEEEVKAQLARAEIEAMNTLAEIVKENEEGQDGRREGRTEGRKGGRPSNLSTWT